MPEKTVDTERSIHETMKILFVGSAGYLPCIEQILPRLLNCRYHFMPQGEFEKSIKDEKLRPEHLNQLFVSELLDNAHLAATTALVRTSKWASAIILAYRNDNYLAWTAAVRGLIESSGDIGDGLLELPGFLAHHHRALNHALAGKMSDKLMDLTPVERLLGHYIRAQWTRDKTGEVPKAKANVDYVRWLERGGLQKAEELYHQLCNITHPASGSIDYLYVYDSSGLRLDTTRDKELIDRLLSNHPSALPLALMLPCNSALLLLRVLHVFRRHPKLPELKKVDWAQIRIWSDIEEALRS